MKINAKFEIYYSNLSQEFFDYLPDFHLLKKYKDRFIEETIEEDELSYLFKDEENETKLNFNFLGKFAKLLHATIDKSLSLESIRSLASALGNLEETTNHRIKFEFQDNRFELARNKPDSGYKMINYPSNKFFLRSGKKLLLQEVNLDQFVAYFQRI